MLMVVFGAGASYDALGDRPPMPPASGLRPDMSFMDIKYRLPLANELFEGRDLFAPWIERFQECAPIVSRLRRLPSGSNLERELEKLQQEAAGYPQRWVQLHAIRYYLRGIIWSCEMALINGSKGVTNYAGLLDRLGYWRKLHPSEEVHFITFDYDTLLERACAAALGLPFPSMVSYMSRITRLYKPHGSVNWVRIVENPEVDAANPEHSIIQLGDSLRLREDSYHVQDPNTSPARLEERHIYPAIALPLETKSAFECPASHLHYLRRDIANVTRLLVIGWRATEAHFLKLWKEQAPVAHLAKVAIVAGTLHDAQVVERHLREGGIGVPTPLAASASSQTRFLLFDKGFTEFLRSPMLDEFLA